MWPAASWTKSSVSLPDPSLALKLGYALSLPPDAHGRAENRSEMTRTQAPATDHLRGFAWCKWARIAIMIAMANPDPTSALKEEIPMAAPTAGAALRLDFVQPGIGRITYDQPGSRANTLNQGVQTEFENILGELERTPNLQGL